jgi:hypothetical protein
MNPVTEVKTNPNPAPESRSVAGGAAAATQPRQNRRQEPERFSASHRACPNSSNQTSITNWQEVC